MSNSFPLHEACRDGKVDQVRELLQEQPKLCMTKDLDGRYPIHWACSFQHEAIVDLLLQHMKNVDLDDLLDDSGWSPLHIACSVGNLELVSKLVNHTIKPDLNLQTTLGVTCLHLACSKQHVAVARYLVENGASTRIKDSKSQLPLHRAASVGNIPLVKLLCDNKSPVDLKDSQGWTPLFHALAEGQGDVAVLLVQEYHAKYKDIQDASGKLPIDVVPDQKVGEYFLKSVE